MNVLSKLVRRRHAITVKEIRGNCIETIPVGTKFIVVGVSAVWEDHFSLTLFNPRI